LALKYYKFFSFIVEVFFEMQVHYYLKEDTVVDGASDIGFVTISIVARIDYHLMNDGLSTTMLTSRVVGGLSSITIFIASISMNTMNNVLPIVVFVDEENVFVCLPSISGSTIDFEDTF
jgi:hypothetical protein